MRLLALYYKAPGWEKQREESALNSAHLGKSFVLETIYSISYARGEIRNNPQLKEENPYVIKAHECNREDLSYLSIFLPPV